VPPPGFAEKHPRLFHLLPAASWASFQRHGLLSAQALCDLYGVPPAQRAALLEEDRGKGNFTVLSAPGLPDVTLRDQLLPDALLLRCLTGSFANRPRAWRALLNGHVFLWADARRARALHGASLAQSQMLLEFDTARLLEPWAGVARTSAINSGAPFAMKPAPRGDGTFLPLADFPRPDGRPVVEVVVPHALPDAPGALLNARPIGQAQGS
jgi:hypothetical protein